MNKKNTESKEKDLKRENDLLKNQIQDIKVKFQDLVSHYHDLETQKKALEINIDAIKIEYNKQNDRLTASLRTNDYLRGKLEVWEKVHMIDNKLPVKQEIPHDPEKEVDEELEELDNLPIGSSKQVDLNELLEVGARKKKKAKEENIGLFDEEIDESVEEFAKKNSYLMEHPK